MAESVQQWVSTVGFDKLTDANGNSSPRLINEAVTRLYQGRADAVQRRPESHVYWKTARLTHLSHQDDSRPAEWRVAETCYFKEELRAKNGPNNISMLLIDCGRERARRAQTAPYA